MTIKTLRLLAERSIAKLHAINQLGLNEWLKLAAELKMAVRELQMEGVLTA